MENSRTKISLAANAFTNIYTATGIAVGTRIAIQNLSSDSINVTIGTSGDINKGSTVLPEEYIIIPAGASGCFIRTISGVGGVVSAQVGGYNVLGAPLDERLYTGEKGLVFQTFTEANSKNGTQWNASVARVTVPAGETLDVLLTTGSKYVLTKGLAVQYTGKEVETILYKNVVATGGTVFPSFNMNTDTMVPMLSVFKSNEVTPFTITNQGTQVSSSEHFYGVADQGNRATPSFIASGIERVLSPNTVYMRRFWNRGTSACTIDFSGTFYEGELSSLN